MAKEITIKPFMKIGDEGAEKYMRDLEDFILMNDASNIKRMILAIDAVAAVVADDLNSLVDPDSDHELRVLSDDKDSKVFDRFMTLVQKVEAFRTVAITADNMIPKIEEYVDPNKKRAIKIDLDSNTFEDLQAKMMEKYGKK